MECPVCKLEICPRSQLNKYTPVININDFGPQVWMYLDPEYKDFQIFQIDNADSGLVEIDIPILRSNLCWFILPSDVFDTSPGQHMYRISLVNKYTSDVIRLYVSYILQNDSPEKSYVYMRDPAPSVEDTTETIPTDSEVIQ